MKFTLKSTTFSLTSLVLMTMGISLPAQAHLDLDFHGHGEQDLTTSATSISASSSNATDISNYLNGPVPTPITDYIAELEDLSSFAPIQRGFHCPY